MNLTVYSYIDSYKHIKKYVRVCVNTYKLFIIQYKVQAGPFSLADHSKSRK
jgi:hypothetical protein